MTALEGVASDMAAAAATPSSAAPWQATVKPQPWHGTLSGYTHHGCKCGDCREAYRVYQRAYRSGDLGLLTSSVRGPRVSAQLARAGYLTNRLRPPAPTLTYDRRQQSPREGATAGARGGQPTC